MVNWRDVRVRNWHRPQSTYMSLLLGQGPRLRHFLAPSLVGGNPNTIERYGRLPWFVIMEWQKPAIDDTP